MSDYTAIAAVSDTLRQVLRQNITLSSDPQLTGIEVYLLSPKEMNDAGDKGVSVWLYKVSRMAEMLNEPRNARSRTNSSESPFLCCSIIWLPPSQMIP